LEEIFQYLVHISQNAHEFDSFEPLPIDLSVRDSKSETKKVFVSSDPSPPSHQADLAPLVEGGEVEHPPIDMSPSPPTPPTQDLCVDFANKLDGCHVVSSLQPSSLGSFDPLDLGVLCSSVLDFAYDVHEDKILDRVGVQ